MSTRSISRQLITRLSFLINLVAVLACQRPQALVQPSTPYWHEPAAITQPAVQRVYSAPSNIEKLPQSGEDTNEAVAYNSSQRGQTQILHKRAIRMQKILMGAERQPAFATIVRQIQSHKVVLSTKNAKYTDGIRVAYVGQLMLIGGVIVALIGVKSASEFLLVLGVLAAGIGSIVYYIGRLIALFNYN